MSSLNVQVPAKLKPLIAPARYKGAHGGRGGAKSHFFGQLAIIKNYSAPLRGVCIREVQNSIKDSVKQLLENKIKEFDLGDCFEITRDEIRCIKGPGIGSLIVFRGMQSYNAENIKSLEDFDWAWVEEAQTLSDKSLTLLRPTIRKPGSEIWFSWNPRHDTDAVDQFLRGANRPKDAVVVEVNWQDNPWFPDVLIDEMKRDYEADAELAEHVWGGGYEIITEGSYYARLVQDAERDGRVGHFPYDGKQVVSTAWDIGVDDYTAIWFVVDDGKVATVVDYYEVSGDGAEDIVKTALPELNPDQAETRAQLSELGRAVPFKYGRHFLPHDVRNREWGAGGRSRRETLIALGVKPLMVGIATNPADRIAASRKLLPITRFHNSPRVALGLKRLRRYRRRWNDALQSYTTPLHDENSHGSDAFGEYAINSPLIPKTEKKSQDKRQDYGARRSSGETSWRMR